MTKKARADLLLVSQGLAPSRERAQSLIMAGVVLMGDQKVSKSSQLFLPDQKLTIKKKDHPYVGRGGVKLKAALDHFKISIKNKVCLDVGASTGGFTNCLLGEGAKKVYAVDVGYGQLDWSLRKKDQVVIIDRINFRYFDPCQIEDTIDVITIDVSFISLTKIVPKAIEILSRSRVGAIHELPLLVMLIKPQFEVGKKFVGKRGVVKNKEKQKECVEKIKEFCEGKGLKVIGTVPSPILGGEGNQEYLLYATLF